MERRSGAQVDMEIPAARQYSLQCSFQGRLCGLFLAC